MNVDGIRYLLNHVELAYESALSANEPKEVCAQAMRTAAKQMILHQRIPRDTFGYAEAIMKCDDPIDFVARAEVLRSYP